MDEEAITLDGLTAFITGASGGIGRQIAITMAGYGANVTIAARSEGIYETADRIAGERALPVEMDVTNDSDVDAAIEETVKRFDGLDCLVNNAGIAGPTAPLEDVSATAYRETLAVNLEGPFLCSKLALPYLRKSDRASIINIGSIGGKMPYPNRTPYAASKMGLIGLSRTMAHELGEDDVTVNTVCPGPVEGDRIERVIEKHAEALEMTYEQAKREVLLDELAIEEFVEQTDVAEVAAYLASPAGRHITAQDINVDSGMTWY